MLFLVPLGNADVGFREAGYNVPKALIPIHGRPILLWVLDVLPVGARVRLACTVEYEDGNIAALVAEARPDVVLEMRILAHATDTVLDTVRCGLSDLAEEDVPVLCLDGDVFHESIDLNAAWTGTNCVFLALRPAGRRFAYAKLDDQGCVASLCEKDPVSDLACTGAYGFASARELCRACKDVGGTAAPFLSSAINFLISGGSRFATRFVQRCSTIDTPLDLRMHALGVAPVTRKRIAFNVDALRAQPRVRDYLRHVRALGHVVVLETTAGGSAAATATDVPALLARLAEWNVSYDELHLGLPAVDFRIGFECANAQHDLHKATGFYVTSVAPRDFHTLCRRTVGVVRKEGGALRPQIRYYEEIPACVRDLFPALIARDVEYTWYEMMQLDGLPFSNLYTAEVLTEGHISTLGTALRRLHSRVPAAGEQERLPLYALYAAKLCARYQRYRAEYDALPEAANLYEQLRFELSAYEAGGHATVGMIHGDAVFTNVLLCTDASVRFIDMRGALDDLETVYGDIAYDYAKVMQSLLGYDEVLAHTRVRASYRVAMLRRFLRDVPAHIQPHLPVLSASLVFSMLPLHTRHHEAFMRLAQCILDGSWETCAHNEPSEVDDAVIRTGSHL